MANAIDHLSNRTKLEWSSKLNTDMQPKRNYRRTSIIGTIGKLCQTLSYCFACHAIKTGADIVLFPVGPKTNSVEKISMLRSGMWPDKEVTKA